jgi:histidine ammonia-lyase
MQNGPALTLNGSDLSIENVVQIANRQVHIEIDSDAFAKVEEGHRLLLAAAAQGHPIYGLNLGVGLNKDRKVFDNGKLTEDAVQESRQFNERLLRSHQVAIGPIVPEEISRAAMAVRLNTMLTGKSGVQPSIVTGYLKLLNSGIHPVMHSRGSVGEADITILPSIGLALMGEGEVFYQGKRILASDALAKEKIKSIQPFAKDALGILSSNAFSAGRACLVLDQVEKRLDFQLKVYALSLEGLNGNLAPITAQTQNVRPFHFQNQMAEDVCNLLEGSYLWKLNSDRLLQDPLSFRCGTQVFAAAREACVEAREALHIQLNSSDDNPAVILFDKFPDTDSTTIKKYWVETEGLNGMVIPTANFEPISWVLKLQSLSVALGHVGDLSCNRVIRFGASSHTGLPRYLTTSAKDHGLAAIEKTSASIRAELKQLIQPVSLDYVTTAGGVEDAGTNSCLVIERLASASKHTLDLASIELFVAAQAVGIRSQIYQGKKLILGKGTSDLYSAFRKEVSIYEGDQTLTAELEKTRSFVDKSLNDE